MRPSSARTSLAGGTVGNLEFPGHGSPGTAARPARAGTGPAAPATRTGPPR